MHLSLRRMAAAATIALSAVVATAAVKIAAPPPTAENVISPTELREHLEFLASNELGGRYTLSPSFAVAARYLASRLEAYGYKPVGDGGTFFQHFDVISSKPKPDE